MLARPAFHEDLPKITFPNYATIGPVESNFKTFFSDHGFDVELLELDLSSCTFVEVATLMHTIAFLKDRQSKQLYTKIRLPRRKTVRDFFRVWEFPKAVNEATGKPFAYFAFEEDISNYFGENVDSRSVKYANWVYIDDAVERLLSDRFFSFISFFPVEATTGTRLAVDESKRWQKPLIESVLRKQLTDLPQGQIASRIIFEAITNAVRHPNAGIILTASLLSETTTKNGGSKGYLTIVVWDDGESMLDTLKKVILRGKPIKYSSECDFDSSFLLIRENDEGHEVCSEVIDRDFTPGKDSDDEHILVSTLLPGITCDMAAADWDVHPDLRNEEPNWVSPGMGLAVLINSAVEVFGGEVAFRTKSFFANVSKGLKEKDDLEARTRYRVKVRSYDETMPEFLGNMITIRVPLWRRSTK